jgi:hypothetical protein
MALTYFKIPNRDNHHLPFLTIKKQEETVILCASPQEFSCIEIHATFAGSTLCEGELLCPMCHPVAHPKRLYTYAPALNLRPSGKWVRVILPIGDINGLVAERDLQGFKVVLVRPIKADKSYGVLQIREAVKVDPALLMSIGAGYFDIKARLLRRYGVANIEASQEVPSQADMPAAESEREGTFLSFADALKARGGIGKAG